MQGQKLPQFWSETIWDDNKICAEQTQKTLYMTMSTMLKQSSQ